MQRPRLRSDLPPWDDAKCFKLPDTKIVRYTYMEEKESNSETRFSATLTLLLTESEATDFICKYQFIDWHDKNWLIDHAVGIHTVRYYIGMVEVKIRLKC